MMKFKDLRENTSADLTVSAMNDFDHHDFLINNFETYFDDYDVIDIKAGHWGFHSYVIAVLKDISLDDLRDLADKDIIEEA